MLEILYKRLLEFTISIFYVGYYVAHIYIDVLCRKTLFDLTCDNSNFYNIKHMFYSFLKHLLFERIWYSNLKKIQGTATEEDH